MRGNAIESKYAKYAVFMRWNRDRCGSDLGADESASAKSFSVGGFDGRERTGCGVEFCH